MTRGWGWLLEWHIRQHRQNGGAPAVSEPRSGLGTHSQVAPYSGAVKPQGLHGTPPWTSELWVQILLSPSRASSGTPFSTQITRGLGHDHDFSSGCLQPLSLGARAQIGVRSPGTPCQPRAGPWAAEHTSVPLWMWEDQQMLQAAPLKEGRSARLLVNSRVLRTRVYF